MGQMKIIMPEMTDLNTYILAERSHKMQGAKIKKRETRVAAYEARNLPEVGGYPVDISFHWYARDRRTDPDNICFAKKFILDGLVDVGVLKKDGWKQIRRFGGDDFSVDADKPRVEVTITWED